jgi:uncharacterized protein RhaS with RHS repeats
MYKLGARYFDPAQGRFTQFDPSGQESNPYAYAGCNPINASDPTGLKCKRGASTASNVLGAISLGAAVTGLVAGGAASAAAAPFTGGLSLAGSVAAAAGAVSLITAAPSLLIGFACA